MTASTTPTPTPTVGVGIAVPTADHAHRAAKLLRDALTVRAVPCTVRSRRGTRAWQVDADTDVTRASGVRAGANPEAELRELTRAAIAATALTASTAEADAVVVLRARVAMLAARYAARYALPVGQVGA